MNKEKDFRKMAEEMTAQLSLDEKIMLLSTHQHSVERLGIGEFFIGHEIARGFVGRDNKHFSTVFPQPIGLAGTFDRKLMNKLGEIAGNECRAYYNVQKNGILCVWGPTVDMERDPRWGRTEEAYGEDVFLAGEMTAAYTLTMAGEKNGYLKTLPTLKHFCANNNEKNRGSSNSYLPLRLKYEYYYAAFMNAVKFGGAKSVMTAYNEINGVPALCNPELQSILKDNWGLWFVVTDGGDFSQNVTSHRWCEKHSETLAEALEAGCDIMTDTDTIVRNAAEKALEAGLITEADIDRSVRNTLYARIRLGQFSNDCPYDEISKDIVDNEEARRINLRASLEQVVLLKNNGILPLEKKSGKIAVLGAMADESLRDWYTGYYRDAISVVDGIKAEFPECEIVHDSLWDVVCVKASNGKYLSVKEDGRVLADADAVTNSELFELQDWGENWKNLFSVKYQRYIRNTDGQLRLHNRTIYDWFTHETFNFYKTDSGFVIEEFLGHQRMKCSENGMILFIDSKTITPDVVFELEVISDGRERARKIAENCDNVIYCTGNYPVQVAKECHDRQTLELNIQPDLASYIHSINPNTVMILVSSYSYSINRENDVIPAIIYTTHAGAFLGKAVAMTLSGRNNPAGRLAMTWYRSELDLPDIMDYDIETAGTTYMYFSGTPLYPFGYGLSYSSFEYGNLKVIQNNEGRISASIIVKNTSDIEGDEVVQLYFTVRDSSVKRPIKKLCGFERVHIKAGEFQTIVMEIPEHILQIYDLHSNKMILEGGLYIFMAGSSSENIKLMSELQISGGKPALRGDIIEAQSCDVSSGIRILYSRKLRRHYIKTHGWSSHAVYKDVCFKGKNKLLVYASSVLGDNVLQLKIVGIKLETKIIASESYDDFSEYIVALPEDLPVIGDIEIGLSESAALLEIKLI